MLEVSCSGAIEKYINCAPVKTLKPVKKPKPINWLTPKVYTGMSIHEQVARTKSTNEPLS